MPLPPHLLVLPLLLVALLALLLAMLRQRRNADAGGAGATSSGAGSSVSSGASVSSGSSKASGSSGSGRGRTASALQMSPAEEVRLLRMQVETLTEALAAARAQAAGAPSQTADRAGDQPTQVLPVPEPVAQPSVPAVPADDVLERTAEPVDVEPVDVEPVVIEPVVIPHPSVLDVPPLTEALPPAVFAPVIEVEPLVAPTAPTAPSAPLEPVEPVGPAAEEPGPDHTAHAYAALSRRLAETGRLREAALAQWAADLRVLAPLVGDRAIELHEAMTALAPADPAAAVSGARAVASSLVDPALGDGIAVTAMLGDTSHLSGHQPGGTRRAYPEADVSADLLPDDVITALESVLVTAAADSGDTARVSVGLRCDLVTHLVSGLVDDRSGTEGRATSADAVALVRDVLQPHERRAFDTELEAALERSREGQRP